MSEYRQDDRDDGYCPVCAKPLTGLTRAARGYCEQHGWVWAEWNQSVKRVFRAGRYVCDECGYTDGHDASCSAHAETVA